MRKTIIAVAAAATTLTAAGVAIADHSSSSGGVAAVAATFSANKESSETYTCTGADQKTYQISRGRYVGTAASTNPLLNGAIAIDVKSVYNTTDKIGWLQGRLKIRRAGDERGSRLGFSAVLTDGGAADGFVAGGGESYSGILGNMSATYAPDVSFTNGKIGGGATGPGQAVVIGKPCARPKPAPIAVRLWVKGEIEALSATEIKVKPRDGSASQACAIKAGVSPSTSGFAAPTATTRGTKVEMGCAPVDNAMTLLKLKKLDGDGDDD